MPLSNIVIFKSLNWLYFSNPSFWNCIYIYQLYIKMHEFHLFLLLQYKFWIMRSMNWSQATELWRLISVDSQGTSGELLYVSHWLQSTELPDFSAVTDMIWLDVLECFALLPSFQELFLFLHLSPFIHSAAEF